MPRAAGAVGGGLRSSVRAILGASASGNGQASAPGRHLLLRVDERDRRRGAGRWLAVLGLDVERRARLRELDRHPDVADVLLEPGRPDRVGHASDLLAVVWTGQYPLISARSSSPSSSMPTSLRSTPLRAELLERGLADVVLRLVLHQALEAHHVERRVVERHVRAVVEDAGLDPAGLARRDRPDAELLARPHDRVPQRRRPSSSRGG